MDRQSIQNQVYETKQGRNVQRLTKGVWEVQSSRYPQLWYRVVLDMDNDKIHCGCKAWKFQSGKGCCKHIMSVIEKEVKSQ